MTLQLFLVRHGESEGNLAGVFTGHSASALTARGRSQAEAVAEALAEPRPTAIYSSDLLRAVETAAPLSRRAGVETIERASLRERDMGAWVGCRFDELEARDPEGWRLLRDRDPDHRPPGGETHRECGARVCAALDEIVRAHPEGRVVVVSHGVAIHHMLSGLLRVDARTLFHVANCALQQISVGATGITRVHCLNDARHLSALEVR